MSHFNQLTEFNLNNLKKPSLSLIGSKRSISYKGFFIEADFVVHSQNQNCWPIGNSKFSSLYLLYKAKHLKC